MEVDVIILSKEGSKYKLQLGMKQTIRTVSYTHLTLPTT